MTKVDLLVTGANFYTMQGQGFGYLAEGAMAVDRGKIVAIGPQAELAGRGGYIGGTQYN